MSLTSILVAASGGSASSAAMETACRIATRAGAHVEGFHVKVDPVQVMMWAGDGLGTPIAGGWIDQMASDADELAKKTEAAFAETAKRHGLPMAAGAPGKASAAWRIETGFAPELVANRARFFDLVVLGRSERVIDKSYSDTVEQTLIHSGRPVLLAPAPAPSAIGETVALGWNGSAEAVHVMAATLPLIARARSVHVISIGEKSPETEQALREHLAWHGVSATYHSVEPVEGVGAGSQLLSEAREAGADLLVMGAYGHRPWREFLFGGATKQVVETSRLPVLLMH
jgi:nucleotide-binding universal stress UspA family protein